MWRYRAAVALASANLELYARSLSDLEALGDSLLRPDVLVADVGVFQSDAAQAALDAVSLAMESTTAGIVWGSLSDDTILRLSEVGVTAVARSIGQVDAICQALAARIPGRLLETNRLMVGLPDCLPRSWVGEAS
jgi:hypothetical protein